MRIAYVVLHLDRKIMQGGVGKKIAAQIRIWKNIGHSAHLFLHSPDQLQFPDTTTFTYHRSIIANPINILARELGRHSALKMMLEQIKAYRPDVIYLRYGLFSFPLQEIFEIAPVVVEMNGDDVNEYRYRGIFYYLLNRFSRAFILKPAAGLVALSAEIGALGWNTYYRKPTLVLANGIDLDDYAAIPAPRNEMPHLGMIFSALFPWHGLDKLIWLAHKYSDLIFELAGYGLQDGLDRFPMNVHIHGFLEPEPLRQLMARLDVSVGTLALHRKKMQEASPLKVREALAYGIPTILAYLDTDLEDLKSDCMLQLPNREDNVEMHAQEIYTFAKHVQGKRVDRKIIANRIDQRKKEEERLRFMMDVTKR